MNQTQILFLSLLRAALWGEKPDASSFAEAKWKQIFHLADVQTVLSLVLDGMGMLPPESLRIPLQEKLKRIGGMQQMERMNSLHRTPGDIDFVVSHADFDRTMAVMEKIGKVDHSHQELSLSRIERFSGLIA